ncbi:cytochrome b [Xanthobacteraceae bacterium A53D]
MTQIRTPPAYSRPARWIHWLTAVAVLIVIPAGIAMMNLPSGPAQDRMFDLHRSLGILILTLAVLRVAVRVAFGAPPRPPGIPDWQWRGASIVHHLLYVLIFVMPLLGWACSSAFGAKVSVFGLFTLPDLVPKNQDMSNLYGGIHAWLGFGMAALVVLHIGAGLYHGFVRRDGVLSRMLPGSGR